MTTSEKGESTLMKQDFYILNYDQVCHLDNILNETMDICGACGLPRISVTIKDFMLKLMHEFNKNKFPMLDIRLNGGAAAAVLDTLGTYQFNDIDILISLDSFHTHDDDLYFNDTIRLVLNVIETLLQPMSPSTTRLFQQHKLSYIQKLIRIQNANNGDSWSLLGLGAVNDCHSSSRKIDLKFTQRIQRQYEFSIDSFQIVLDSLLMFYEAVFTLSTSRILIAENFFPTVAVYSKWDSLSQALDHLTRRLIVTTMPEKIRGGGLLKYCKLIVQGFTVQQACNVALLERYMCSRFFIDYADLESQQKAIESFIKNHFNFIFGIKFLEKLQIVILSSSICLMKNERHQILDVIQELMCDLNRFYMVSPTKDVLCSLDQEQAPSSLSNNTIVMYLNESSWTLDTIVDEGFLVPSLRSSFFSSQSSTCDTSWTTSMNLSLSDLS